MIKWINGYGYHRDIGHRLVRNKTICFYPHNNKYGEWVSSQHYPLVDKCYVLYHDFIIICNVKKEHKRGQHPDLESIVDNEQL